MPVELDEHSRRTGRMWSGLAGSSLILIAGGDWQPGEEVGCRFGLQRGNPGPRRHHIRFNAPIFTRTTAGEFSHGVRAIAINDEIKPVVFSRAGRNDVFSDRGAADALGGRPGVTGGEFQDVLLVAESEAIGIADQFIKLHRAQIIATLGIVAPTVGTDDGPGAGGIASQFFEARRRLRVSDVIKDPLGNDAGTGSNSQAVQCAVLIGFTDGPVAG